MNDSPDSQETLKMMEQMVKGQGEFHLVIQNGFNSIECLLADNMKNKDEIIAQKESESCF